MLKKAFSLMELMVVIVILGLLAIFILPNLLGKGEKAKVKITCIQMKSIGQVLKMYKLDYSSFPSTQEGITILQEKEYFDEGKTPKDAWGNEFIYVKEEKSFEIMSMGANQEEGGDDDIYYSKCLN